MIISMWFDIEQANKKKDDIIEMYVVGETMNLFDFKINPIKLHYTEGNKMISAIYITF